MRLIKNTTELIGITDPNIIVSLVLKLILTSRFKQNSIVLNHHALIDKERLICFCGVKLPYQSK